MSSVYRAPQQPTLWTAASKRQMLPVVSGFVRSASRHQLIAPHRRSKFDRRAFSVAGPMAWNSLPGRLRDPTLSSDDAFRSALKTYLSAT